MAGRRGIQTALLAARLSDATAAGAAIAVITVQLWRRSSAADTDETITLAHP